MSVNYFQPVDGAIRSVFRSLLLQGFSMVNCKSQIIILL